MASVIRVKRRINEDPAEALRLSCKRQRQSQSCHSDTSNQTGTPVQDDSTGDENDASKGTPFQDLESVLSFAGTLSSKDEPVSRHIKEAIRRTKLHREMHPHATDGRNGLRDKLSSKLREQASESSRSNRYRVTWSRRALDLDLLDKEVPPDESEGKVKGTSHPVKETVSQDDKENSRVLPSEIAVPATKPLETAAPAADVVREDKMFCIFDVESDDEQGMLGSGAPKKQDSKSGITLNNVPLVTTNVAAPLAESEYVYDLYYTHSNLSSLDVEAVLTVQSICDQFVNEEEDGVDRDLVYDDEDDSNDESNWRNDYPDEDPHFFENEDDDGDCYYAEDMIDTNVLDDGDMLAQWLGSRCKVEADSDDDDAEEYGHDNSDSSDCEF